MISLVDVYEYEFTTAVEFLYELLGERKVSESISHKRHPSFTEHYKFVQSRPYLGWYLIIDNPTGPVGTCYITKTREVGIWLMPQAKGKGAGKQAINQLLAMYPGRVFTNTSVYNSKAKDFYERMGFRHCANMLEHDNDGVARSGDNPSKTEQQPAAEEGARTHWRFTDAGVDIKSGEGCQEC